MVGSGSCIKKFLMRILAFRKRKKKGKCYSGREGEGIVAICQKKRVTPLRTVYNDDCLAPLGEVKL